MYPHHQYCDSVWGQAPKSTLKPIQILQNRAVKIISKTYHRQSLLLLNFRLKFLRFDDIVQLQIAKLMHSIVTKLCQNFNLILPKWRIPITIALDLQQALITTSLKFGNLLLGVMVMIVLLALIAPKQYCVNVV